MNSLRLLAVVLPVFYSLPAQAALRAGSKPTEWPASAVHHTVTIERVSANDHEKNLIAAAEKSRPVAAALLEAIRKHDSAAKPVAGQWWNKEVLGIRIPFAVTDEAVRYYEELVNGFAQQKLVRYAQPASTFTYLATISESDTYELSGKKLENVTVVTLTMNFRQSFVTTVAEGFHFEKTRTVVFSREGTILGVTGDGDTIIPLFAM